MDIYPSLLSRRVSFLSLSSLSPNWRGVFILKGQRKRRSQEEERYKRKEESILDVSQRAFVENKILSL